MDPGGHEFRLRRCTSSAAVSEIFVCSHQSTTLDGRVLNSKATVLAFLEEVDVALREGRTFEP